MKDNFMKENGMAEEKFFFLTQQQMKEFGFKIQNNDN